MGAADVGVVSSRDNRGGLVVRVGIPLADVYLEFLGGRCRPNTVLAAAYDLKVFFAVVAGAPDQVRPADVLAFITAQRTGRGGDRALQPVGLAEEPGGVSAATVRRRLSIVSGFFAFLQARGDVTANPVPRGLPTRRERSRPGQGVPLVRAVRRLPRILAPAQGRCADRGASWRGHVAAARRANHRRKSKREWSREVAIDADADDGQHHQENQPERGTHKRSAF